MKKIILCVLFLLMPIGNAAAAYGYEGSIWGAMNEADAYVNTYYPSAFPAIVKNMSTSSRNAYNNFLSNYNTQQQMYYQNIRQSFGYKLLIARGWMILNGYR